jgi:hypothetical protein
MNKKSKQRAFFVYVIICFLYVLVTFRIPEKLSMTRTSDAHVVPSNSSILPLPEAAEVAARLPPEGAPSCTPVPQALTETAESDETLETAKAPLSAMSKSRSTNGLQSGIEPSLLISIPVICHAFKEGWLEKDSLIFVKKDAYNNVSWRKPLEILKDHDEEGIGNILNTIGQKRVVEFMKKEGVRLRQDLSVEDLFSGKGYVIEQAKLIDLYDRHVGESCNDLFPFSSKEVAIVKGPKGEFRLAQGTEVHKGDVRTTDQEWMMPNLASLPIRAAVEKLAVHTSNIKVYGNGYVLRQSPRPFERVKGQTACIIQGRGVAE